MTPRFVIRKLKGHDYHDWALRDRDCAGSGGHDFTRWAWPRDCTGACNTFLFFESAIGAIHGSGGVE